MRGAFEKWWLLHYSQSAHFIRHNRSGDYMNPHVQTGWKVWQAACVDVVEKLKPREFDTLRWNEKEQQYDETTAVEMSDVYEVLNDNH